MVSITTNKRFYRSISLLILLTSFQFSAISQEESMDEDINWSERLIQEVKLENPVYKPVLSAGVGILQFHGDVKNPYNKDVTLGTAAFNIDVYRALTPDFKFGFRFLYGQLNGNTVSSLPKYNRNFQTQMMSYGVGLTYNFAHIPIVGKNENRILSPYITFGGEFINYDVFGDKKSLENQEYHYWSDGSIKDKPENEDYQRSAKTLYRDYDYETSLSNENIDKLNDPTPVTFGLPIDIGFDFILSQKVQFRIGYNYHITFNDIADNITTKGSNYDKNPERKGEKGNDRFSYAYASFTLDLFSKTTEERQLQFLDLGAGGIFDFWDMDGDFVMDIYDQCPWTPYGQPVDTVGCPFDDDGDNVPNHADEEKNTPKNTFYINGKGVAVSEADLLKELNNKQSFSQVDIYRHYPSLLDGTGLYRRFYKEIPGKFKSLDIDKDDYISLPELLKSIDGFFDGTVDLKVEDLYELNEFFFIQ